MSDDESPSHEKQSPCAQPARANCLDPYSRPNPGPNEEWDRHVLASGDRRPQLGGTCTSTSQVACSCHLSGTHALQSRSMPVMVRSFDSALLVSSRRSNASNSSSIFLNKRLTRCSCSAILPQATGGAPLPSHRRKSAADHRCCAPPSQVQTATLAGFLIYVCARGESLIQDRRRLKQAVIGMRPADA